MKIYLISLSLLLAAHSATANSFKKITLVKTNNAPYFLNSGEYVAGQNSIAYLKKLKSFIAKHGYQPDTSSETKYVTSSLAWVNAQWDHDGMNEPPKTFNALDILNSVYTKKEKYRCVEFGLVLSEVLESSGFVTRSLSLRANDVAYGGFGSGHVVSEVWLNELNKWIFLDGQFGVYITKAGDDMPLSYYEIFQQKAGGQWPQLQIHFVKAPENPQKAVSDYKAFLSRYFGHITTSQGTGKPRISLLLDAKEMPLTFQGLPLDGGLATKDASLFYPLMNRVSLNLEFRQTDENFQKLMEKLQIKNNDDYMKHMPEFAAEPKFTVRLHNTEPLFDHYEYRVGAGDWKTLKKPEFPWDAMEELNHLEVRAVNKLGRPGPSTFMDIAYH